MSDGNLIPQEQQSVYVSNEGNDVFIGMFRKQTFTIEPGQRVIVPFLAMCLWCGHPDAWDDERDKHRTDEARRLRVKYGIYESGDWDADTPNLVVQDMVGNQLVTVLNDKDGDHLTPAIQSAAEKQQLMDAIQAQVAGMQAQAQQGDTAPLPPEHGATDAKSVAPEATPSKGPIDGDVPTDSPSRIPAG